MGTSPTDASCSCSFHLIVFLQEGILFCDLLIPSSPLSLPLSLGCLFLQLGFSPPLTFLLLCRVQCMQHYISYAFNMGLYVTEHFPPRGDISGCNRDLTCCSSPRGAAFATEMWQIPTLPLPSPQDRGVEHTTDRCIMGRKTSPHVEKLRNHTLDRAALPCPFHLSFGLRAFSLLEACCCT